MVAENPAAACAHRGRDLGEPETVRPMSTDACWRAGVVAALAIANPLLDCGLGRVSSARREASAPGAAGCTGRGRSRMFHVKHRDPSLDGS